MATRTDNLGLIKPDLDDNIDVTQLNANSDIIDGKVKENADNIELVKQEIQKYLPLTGGTLTGDLNVLGALTVKDNLTFSNDYNQQTYITKDNTAVILNSNYASQENWVLFKSDNQYASFRPNGNFNISGTTYRTTTEQAILQSDNGIASVEVNDNQSVQIRANKESSIIINGQNFAFNPDGRLWINGKQSFVDDYYDTTSGEFSFRYWNVNDYTILLGINYKNTSNSVSYNSVTFPIPFINNHYVVSANMRTHESQSTISINGDYRTVISNCTTTGLTFGTDKFVETELFIIGRVK